MTDNGIVQEIFDQLPTIVRDFLLFGWAKEFQQIPTSRQDPLLVDLFSTITSLSFIGHQRFDIDEFKLLRHLPLTKLRELVILDCKLTPPKSSLTSTLTSTSSLSGLFPRTLNRGDDVQCSLWSFLTSCPVFNNLQTLRQQLFSDVSSTRPLFHGQNTFPHLTKLEILGDYSCRFDLAELFANPSRFPSLKSLTILVPSITTLIESASVPDLFRLDELSLESVKNDSRLNESVLSLLKSPVCTQLTKLSLSGFFDSLLEALVREDTSRYLFSIGSQQRDSPKDLWHNLLISPIVSNLDTLSLCGSICDINVSNAFEHSQYLTNLRHLRLNSWGQRKTFLSPPGPLYPYLTAMLSNLPCKLETITLEDCSFPTEDLSALGSAPCLSNLKQLDCSSAFHSPQGPPQRSILDLVHTSRLFSNLTSLSLGWQTLKDPVNLTALASFLSSPNLSNNLSSLDIGHLPFDNQPVTILGTTLVDPNDPSRGLKFGQLKKLVIHNSSAKLGDIHPLTNLSSLSHFELRGFFTSEDAFIDEQVCTLLTLDSDISTLSNPVLILPNLNTIIFSASPVGDVVFNTLSKSPVLEQFKSIEFKWDQERSAPGTVSALLTAPHACNLTSISISTMASPSLLAEQDIRSQHHLQYCEVMFR